MNESDEEKPLQPQQRRPWLSYVPKELGLFLAFAVLIVLGYFGRDFTKQLGPPERCWELKEVDGKLYKANPCTGQFLLLGDAPGR